MGREGLSQGRLRQEEGRGRTKKKRESEKRVPAGTAPRGKALCCRHRAPAGWACVAKPRRAMLSVSLQVC